MSSRITGAFCTAGRPLIVACIVAGYPSFDESIRVARELVSAGTDIIEIVMPFSDPVADGPVIQQADTLALASGMNTDRLFDMIREVRKETDIPLLIMTYANIVIQRGIQEFYSDAANAGADGVVIADVPLEEADPFCAAAGTCRDRSYPLYQPDHLSRTHGEDPFKGRWFCVPCSRTGGDRDKG